MPGKQIVIVRDGRSGDWEGLYVDGRLVYEGHSLDADTVLQALNIEHQWLQVVVGDGGRLPVALSDVRTEEMVQREEMLAEATALRARADELHAQADAISLGAIILGEQP